MSAASNGRVIGLGLSKPSQTRAESIACTMGKEAFDKGYFPLVLSHWMKMHGILSLAIVPFGKLGREVAMSSECDGDISFFDSNPTGSALALEGVFGEKDLPVVIATSAYGEDLKGLLVAGGVPKENLVFLDEIINDIKDPAISAQGVSSIEDEIVRLGATRTYVATKKGQGKRLYEALKSGRAKEKLVGYFDYAASNRESDDDDCVHNASIAPIYEPDLVCIGGVSGQSERDLVRQILYMLNTEATVVLPYADKGSWATENLPCAEPVLLDLTAFAGSSRCAPIFFDIARKFGRSCTVYEGPAVQMKNIAALRRGEGVANVSLEESFAAFLRTLDLFQFGVCHGFFPLHRIDGLSDVKVVKLMRDPRDMINSYAKRVVHFGLEANIKRALPDKDYEDVCLNLLRGDLSDYPDAMDGACVEETARSLVFAHESDTIYSLRYEDMRTDAHQAFGDMLNWLGWHPDPLSRFSESDMDKAIYLGTFEYQTGGKVTDKGGGSDVYMSGATVRKGLVGDWSNNWSQRLKDAFKEATGDALVRLGYEDNMDW